MATTRPRPRAAFRESTPPVLSRREPVALRTTPPSSRAGAKPSAKTRAVAKVRKEGSDVIMDAATISARILPLCTITGVLFLALVCRLGYLQVVKHGEFVKRATDARERFKTLPARRGALLDRMGNILVQTEPTWDVVVDPNIWFAQSDLKKGETPEVLRQRVGSALTTLLPGVDVMGILSERGFVKGSTGRLRPIDVAKRQSEDIRQKIKDANLLGVGLHRSEKRVAIDGGLAPQVLGFIGVDGNGLNGLEWNLDSKLAGTDGSLNAEFVKGRAIPGTVRTDTPPQHGQDTVLTLDADIQHIVQDSLGKQFEKTKSDAAIAVVMDPKTGDILALANYPMGDINEPKKNAEEWSNRAVTAMYEPGSTLKAITFAAALEEKAITLQSGFDCPGFMKIGRQTIHCHDNERHGSQDASSVLANSCNICTALIARRLSKEKLGAYLTTFGFGDKCRSGLPGEAKGQIVPPSIWSDIRWANVSFGQGISVTGLQLASAYCAIANDGVRMQPRIIYGVRSDSGEIHPDAISAGRRVVSAQTARTLQQMLTDAMEKGTGKPARLDGYSAAGKTGTAQFAENGHYGGKFVSSFAGMAPSKDPQLVILVSLINPKGEHYGGTMAGPVFREIAEKTFALRRIPHDFPSLAERVKLSKKTGKLHSVRD